MKYENGRAVPQTFLGSLCDFFPRERRHLNDLRNSYLHVKTRPGPEFEKRYEAALPVRLKYSELAAFWHTEIGPLNQVIHVWPYEDLAHRTEIRGRLAKEPGWPPKADDLLVSMESGIYVPAPFHKVGRRPEARKDL